MYVREVKKRKSVFTEELLAFSLRRLSTAHHDEKHVYSHALWRRADREALARLDWPYYHRLFLAASQPVRFARRSPSCAAPFKIFTYSYTTQIIILFGCRTGIVNFHVSI